MDKTIILIIYLIVVNLFSFALFGIDKYKAKTHKWRVSEKALFISAIIGGSLGALAGMYSFRHKTKHWYFVIGIPCILLIQVVIVALLISRKVI
jgi:uncharacterized membrane protein YsdA (DUF1294 family)